MAFMRVSLMTPLPDQDQHVVDLLDDLVRFYQQRPGFITAWRLSPDEHAVIRRYGRVSVWESEDDAHRTASEQRDLAIQSQLRLVISNETHEEYSFIATGLQE